MAEFAASHAGTETVVADRDRIVLEGIGEVITTFGHSTHEDTDALIGIQVRNVVTDFDHFGIEGESDLPAVWWQMIRDRVLDDFEQFLLRIDRSDRQLMKKLNHQTCKALKSSRNADCWADFDESTFGGVNEDLQLAGLVDGRIQ